MKTVFDKISQYAIVTNILPGSVLCGVLKFCVGYDMIIVDKILWSLVIFYFVGMVNNRISSLVVKPILSKIGFISEEKYEDYIEAEAKDSKIELLSQENDVYRSYISVFLLAIVAKIFKIFDDYFTIDAEVEIWIGLFVLLFLFVFSFREQTAYVKKRIVKANDHK